MKRFLLLTLVVAFAVSGCGGSIEETIAEELIENSDGSISDVEINQDSGEFEISIDWMLNTLGTVWEPLLLGCFILGTSAAAIGNVAARIVWRIHVLHNWRKRQRLRLERG